jgi:phosphoglycolate phosphatase
MLLFFDLDGPLLDVSPRYVALHQQLLTDLGARGMDGALYWKRKRACASEEAILNELGRRDLATAYSSRRLELIETRAYLAHDRPWPWARPMLGLLARRHRLILVTARASRPFLEEQLDTLDLAGFFDEVLSERAGPRVDEQKAALIREYLHRHGEKARGWMIGDTEADVGAGKRVGLRTAAVLSGIRNAEILLRSEPDYLLHDISELPFLQEQRQLNVLALGEVDDVNGWSGDSHG